jgi:hypothetical protein
MPRFPSSASRVGALRSWRHVVPALDLAPPARALNAVCRAQFHSVHPSDLPGGAGLVLHSAVGAPGKLPLHAGDAINRMGVVVSATRFADRLCHPGGSRVRSLGWRGGRGSMAASRCPARASGCGLRRTSRVWWWLRARRRSPSRPAGPTGLRPSRAARGAGAGGRSGTGPASTTWLRASWGVGRRRGSGARVR